MEDEQSLRAAQSIYATLCRMLDKKGWHYEKMEEQFAITCQVGGEDIPIRFTIYLRKAQQVAVFFSYLPFKIPEDKRIDAAVAVAVANNGMAWGSFDYDISTGEICFRLAESYYAAELSEDTLERMMLTATISVDDYNDKFLMLSKGVMTLAQFIDSEKRD